MGTANTIIDQLYTLANKHDEPAIREAATRLKLYQGGLELDCIRETIKQRGIRQSARDIDLSESTLKTFYYGVSNNPNIETYKKLIKLLDIEL